VTTHLPLDNRFIGLPQRRHWLIIPLRPERALPRDR
jgi:hypothetical protein